MSLLTRTSPRPEPDTDLRPDVEVVSPRLEALIEAEPFWSALGRLRRRPPVYAVCSVVMASTSLVLGDPKALWIAVALAVFAAASVLRSPAPETVVTYSSDILALAAGVVFIGLDPLAGMALWSAIVVVAFFGLPRRQARFVMALAMIAIAVTLLAGRDWAFLDLTETTRLIVSVILTAIGFVYLGTVIPALADTTRDILRTADASTEAQRRQAEFRAQLASTVAHELRNPLAGIRGFIDVLVTEGDELSPSEHSEYLSIIASQTASLEGIVEDLLVAVQGDEDRLTVDDREFDASHLVNRVITELGPGASDGIEIEVQPGLMAVGDPSRVGQILRNLVSNARKYGGPRIRVSGERSAGSVRLVVFDDGDGIAQSDVVRMFERFEGTARGSAGYGLGLPISRQLARAMGGDLTYEPGDGATFVLTLRAV